MERNYRALVVEDEPRILQHLAQKIAWLDPRFEIAGTARNGADALALARELRPDVVFSDVYMPVMDGIELSARLRQQLPGTGMVIISGFRDFDYAREALRNGVTDYLLKPIADQELSKVLSRVSAQIDRSLEAAEDAAVRAAAAGRLEPDAAPRGLAALRFQLALLNVGNLMGAVPDAAHERVISRVIEEMDCAGALREAGPSGGRWVCGGLSPAQRLLVIEHKRPLDLKLLLERLSARAEGYSVTLCAARGPCALGGLQAELHRLAAALGQRLSPGHSALIDPDATPDAPMQHLSRERINLFKGHIQVQRYDLAESLLGELLERWDREACPQYLAEANIRQLIHSLALLRAGADEGGLYLAERAALSAVCAARRFTDALGELWAAFEELLRPDETLYYSQKTIDDIEAYLRAHYAEDLTVESIADRIGFHAVYLNRIFKKHKQLTLLQYLITLRMEKAKQLMREYPEWDLALVGESVGYSDPHYFSRAFKKSAGCSPSEWRDAFGKA